MLNSKESTKEPLLPYLMLLVSSQFECNRKPIQLAHVKYFKKNHHLNVKVGDESHRNKRLIGEKGDFTPLGYFLFFLQNLESI